MTDYMTGRPVVHESLQASSPLATLVRQTSTRRTGKSSPGREQRHGNYEAQPEPLAITVTPEMDYGSPERGEERRKMGRPPSSPLLHTRFRASTGTQHSFNTLAMPSQDNSFGYGQDVYYDEDSSIYMPDYPSPRGFAGEGGKHDSLDVPDYKYRPRRSSELDPFVHSSSPSSPVTPPSAVPQVRVDPPEQYAYPSASTPSSSSTAYPPVPASAPATVPAGRVPSATGSINYSRPHRPSVEGTEDAKRRVLERNAQRRNAPHSAATSMYSQSNSMYSQSRDAISSAYSVVSAPGTPYNHNRGQESRAVPTRSDSDPAGLNTAPPARSRSNSPLHPDASTSTRPSGPSRPPRPPTLDIPDPVMLSASGPSTHQSADSGTPVSVYSNYSYYPFESAAPSPVGATLQVPGTAPAMYRSHSSPQLGSSSPSASGSGAPSSSSARPSTSTSRVPSPSSGPRTADDYLQLGITHHEANRLEESARCFEQSARLSVNSPNSETSGVGMLMYGLTLRHGWGCPQDEKAGFAWLRRAAEAAVGDLERFRREMPGPSAPGAGGKGGKNDEAVKVELILAIYEVGQCFVHGWGVKKDPKMGVSYFRVAANLGDADAQQELAFCLANGRGCKKDRKEAAHWYREAVKQGASDVGLAWIYKEKFQ
ncbi:unnamed protein product [Peniophora sp. CBMAI 1063]|nr:unnamed protein product [Peniophora sp. CBMAI 1063]